MSDKEKETGFMALTLAVCAGGLLAGLLGTGCWYVAKAYPSVSGCFGTLLAALAIWIVAYESGRQFEREHGQRVCGPENEKARHGDEP